MTTIRTVPEREIVRPVDEVRRLLAERPTEVKCHPECRGWVISHVDDEREMVIERCDECDANARAVGLPHLGWDDEVMQLPEAQRALAQQMEA